MSPVLRTEIIVSCNANHREFCVLKQRREIEVRIYAKRKRQMTM